jgi:hypothetical protein
MKRIHTQNLYIQANTTDDKYFIRDRKAPADAKPLKTCKSWSDAHRALRDIKVEALKVIGQQKRQRHVFPTDEIPHLWYHKTQDSARNAQGNLYFRDETIFSYGDHFPIARHIKNASGKKSAVLFTSKDYSVTTSGHKSAVRRAIPDHTTVFSVPRVGGLLVEDHAENLAHFVTVSQDRLAKAGRARANGKWDLDAAFALRETAKSYAKFFGVSGPKFDFLPTGKTLAGLKKQIAERAKRHNASQALASEREQARRAEQDRIDMLDFAEKSALWRAGNPNVRLPWGADTLLRIKGSEVETSRGARVPVSHAIALLATIRKVVARGEEFTPNGHTIHIGHYSVNKIATDGTLTAGCHVIKYGEIELLAPVLESMIAKLPAIKGTPVTESEASNV